MWLYKNKFVLHGVGITFDENGILTMLFLDSDNRIKTKADKEKLCDRLMVYMKAEGFIDVEKMPAKTAIKFATVKTLDGFDDNSYEEKSK